jgi:hypothetical protein
VKKYLTLLMLAILLFASGACNGTTGDQLITFPAFAAGVAGASQPFTVGGFTVQLTAAKMRIGAVYFNESPPSTGFDSPVCITSGIYAAQVAGPIEVDLLSTRPQEFSVFGNGSEDTALSWQLWLTDGDVNEANFAHVVDLEGVATRGTESYSFGAIVTINQGNRGTAASDPAQPGQFPICKTRVVQIGGIDLSFFDGGTLTVTVDPRAWFTLGVDFSALPPITDDDCLAGDDLVALDSSDYAMTPEIAPAGVCGESSQSCCANDVCLGSLACNSGTCGPRFCIPNTNKLNLQWQNFFTSIVKGGPYAVEYSR